MFTKEFSLLFLVCTLSITFVDCQNQYNFDIKPNSRLLQSLGLATPDNNVQPYTSSWNGISTSRVLADSYEPISGALYLQPPSIPSSVLYTSQPKKVTYLTVGERQPSAPAPRPLDRPRPRPRTRPSLDRSQTIYTVSDVEGRRNYRPSPVSPPSPPPPVYSNEVSGDDNVQAKPYSFEYEANDEQSGLRSSRSEKSDGQTVTGSYSYYDADGVYRIVEYTADEGGFRANIRTNEPGTGGQSQSTNPAGTTWQIEQPPQQVVDKYYNKRY